MIRLALTTLRCATPWSGWLVAAPIACLLLGAPAAAGADGPGGSGFHGVPGMSEPQLEGFETRALGPGHASEHARQRKAVRESADVTQAPPAPRAAAVAPSDPQVKGAWAAPFALRGAIGIHALMLPTGKVMYFSYPRNPRSPSNMGNANKNGNVGTTVLWDPSKGSGPGAFKSVPPPLWDSPTDGTPEKVPANIWCAGQAFLADGRALIVGGNLAYNQKDPEKGYYRGLNQAYTFNPWKERWTRQPDMSHGRWYPSEVLMPDGRVAIMGGLSDESKPQSDYYTNKAVDLFTPSKSMDGVGKITGLGVRNGGATVDDGVPPDGGLYPHLFWMLNGKVLVAGPDKRDSWFLDDPGESNAFRAGDAPDASRHRVWGTAVLLPEGPAGSSTVEQIGGSPYAAAADGSLPATKTTEAYTSGAASWTTTQPLNEPRSHLNTVLLPDRSMITVGGGVGKGPDANPAGQWAATGRERQVEVYSPTSRQWTLGAPQTEARAYHSTALLLPDARVVSAGDDYNGSATAQHADGSGTGMDSDTAEIYSPPYLYNRTGADIGKPAARPIIAGVPQVPIGYDSKFQISTPTGSTAVLVAPGAVTHANDMNQRVVPLTTTPQGNGLEATAPANANVALPGCYMLFTLNVAGVPSVAKWIQLGTPTAGPGMCGKPASPDPPAKPTAPVKPGPDARDRSGPKIVFRRRSGFNARHGRVRGRAEDGSGVKTVQVALRVRRGKRCRWFSPMGRRFVRRSCVKARWIKARVRRSTRRGVYVWGVRLHRAVRAGRYQLAVRAVDSRGNVTVRGGTRAFRISVKR